jgi:hypothetical protein
MDAPKLQMDVHDQVKTGLDQASALKPGHGWVTANVEATSDAPLLIKAEAGMKFTPDLAGYTDAWAQPTTGRYGADAGLRVRDNLDIFAGGYADTSGEYGVQAGIKYTF